MRNLALRIGLAIVLSSAPMAHAETCYYGGEPLPNHGNLYLVFLGSSWTTNSSLSAQRARIISDVRAALGNGYFSKLSQYGVGTGTVSAAFAVGDIYVPTSYDVYYSNWAAIDPLLQTAVHSQLGAYPPGDLASVYVFFYPPGISMPPGLAAFHTLQPLFSVKTNVAFVGYSANDANDYMAIDALHEAVESVTDPHDTPYDAFGWTCTGEELEDVCGGLRYLSAQGFSLPGYFSVSDGVCEYPYTGPAAANGASVSWQPISGSATAVAVSAADDAWVLGTDSTTGGYHIYHYLNGFFSQVPGGAVRIAVDPWGNPWVVSSSGNIYHWNGASFQQVSGQAREIAIGVDGSVWVIGVNQVAGGYAIYRWNGYGFSLVPGGAVKLAVDSEGNAWLVNSANAIFRFDGSSFVALSGSANSIGAGPGGIWVVGTDSNLYRWSGISWVHAPGAATQIAVGRNYAWVINASAQIYRAGL